MRSGPDRLAVILGEVDVEPPKKRLDPHLVEQPDRYTSWRHLELREENRVRGLVADSRTKS